MSDILRKPRTTSLSTLCSPLVMMKSLPYNCEFQRRQQRFTKVSKSSTAAVVNQYQQSEFNLPKSTTTTTTITTINNINNHNNKQQHQCSSVNNSDNKTRVSKL